MSTSIGDLSVGVSLNLSGMESGIRKAKAQLSQLDKAYKKIPGSDAFGFGGEWGGGPGRARSRSGGGFIRPQLPTDSFGGGLAGRLAGKIGGDSLGTLVGGGRIGDMLAGAGAAGGIAAGAAAVVRLQVAIGDFAKNSGRTDAAALAAGRFSDSVRELGAGLWDFAKNRAVDALGTLNRAGEFIGAGGDRKTLDAFDAAQRGAIQQQAARDRLFAINDPAKVAALRAQLSQFRRDQAFGGLGLADQETVLGGEIRALEVKEKAARASKEILEAEQLRLEIEQKRAQLDRIGVARSQEAALENNVRLEQKRLEKDAADAEARERTREGIENDVGDFLRDLDRQREINDLRLSASPLAVSAGASSLGGTAGDGATAAGLLREQIRAIGRLEEIMRDIAEQQAFRN